MTNENWEIYTAIGDEAEERQAAEFFDYSSIKVEYLNVHITDEFNGEAHIEMSNGDTIDYVLTENGSGYEFEFSVNDEDLGVELDDVLNYGTGTIAGDILHYYWDNYIE